MAKATVDRGPCGNIIALGLLFILSTAAGAVPLDPIAPGSLQVGVLTLHHCESGAPWCGTLTRPLDPTGRIAADLPIYFEFYPHTDPGPAVGTLVATEGGPGFPATESRDEYLELFQPLRSQRDVLIMDNRGTGRSGAVDCRELQTEPTLTEENVAQCGRYLGARAPLYSVAYAADDLAAILESLGQGPVDLYGDSYGTFFEQVFALRHPDKLRSLVLDGAYPLNGPGYAWYPNYAPAMRDKFNLACQRSQACRSLPGSSLDHMAAVLDSLRHHPLAARAQDGEGRLRTFTADATQLAMVMFGSAPAYASVRELDAAARAFIIGDTAPLLRLMAETQVGVDSRDETRSPSKFSAGLAAAVMCQDAPQIFDMTMTPTQRRASRNGALAERKRMAADTYAPFTIDEYRGLPLDYGFIDECVAWPAVPVGAVSARELSQIAYPDIPALIVSGDLDNMTPLADGTMVARRFAHGHQLIVPNGFHVNALPHARTPCPAQIVRRFIETLSVADTSCLRDVPEVRLAPQFARRVGELAAAKALNGNAAPPSSLRVANGAVLTVADAIARIGSNSTGGGAGLRGGTFDVAHDGERYRLSLHAVRWTEDLSVSGTIEWPGRAGTARAELMVTGPNATSGPLAVHWTEGIAHAQARISGTLHHVSVKAETDAP